ncbi:hypothetical protein B0H66DRAFT_356907 [Apodospora peruviana]|uniref:Uncharacterized protein n=1 Tax=Apodospora peruviana TaxID=516989 RepID=A0AAE0LZL3_9PEZI|nr:hypothetical protein B0H66DRAFT_356907 [Apodospora peruviana]
MAMSPAQQEDLRLSCTEYWKEAFNEGPHTSFTMIELMRSLSRISYTDLLQKRKLKLLHGVTNLDRSPYDMAWAYRTGRCTSFAIKVARRLENDHPEQFCFRYYDLGAHRIARCDITGIVIDSESVTGARYLTENEGWDLTPENGSRGRLKYVASPRGHSKFQEKSGDARRNKLKTVSINPISPRKALEICLRQAAERISLVCAFRSIEYTVDSPAGWVTRFHSTIKWRITHRRIELTPYFYRPQEIFSITFGRGDLATNRNCIRNFVAFVRARGIEEQWKADGIDEINKDLWKAAVKVWGYPTWTQEILPPEQIPGSVR